jgi:acyl-homoserine lactone acylase PvdQ
MERSSFFKLLVSLLTITLLPGGCTPGNNQANEIKRWEKQAAEVTILRDTYSVPHIYAKTDALVVFGLMYAQCEDDFNRVETNYINSMGRIAEVEGESQLFTDLRMRLFIDTVEVKKEYENSPRWLKELMDAYADGINYYLFKHPEVKPRLLTRFEPWMALTFSEGSIGGDIETIPVSGLKMFYGDQAIAESKEEKTEAEYDAKGSNGFAISPTISASGNALLLINPHTSLFFRSEVHMVSDEGLNSYGAVTWGQFFVYQGFNEHCGWMHTSSAADVIDYYLETVVEKEGKYYYKYGNEQRPFTEKNIRLNYKENGNILSKEITVYYSHHGPVIRTQDDKWVTVKLMVEHEKALTQSYMRTKARSYEEFNKVMELRTNSSNNTVYADNEGIIAYFHGNFMPVRDPKFDWSKPVDGSDPETEWKGLHSIDEMITIKNPANGWIQNCNSTPFTASGDNSPKRENYPAYMAPDAENPRGLHAVKVLQNKTDFTIDKLISAAYDSYLTAFENMIPSLVRAYNHFSLNDPDIRKRLAEPIEMLDKWDMRYSLTSVPTSLAIYYGQELMATPVEPVNDTVSSSFMGRTEKQQLDALSAAIGILDADFGTWKTPWGEINRYQRITGDIVQQFNDERASLPVPFASSRWGSLASFQSRKYPGTKKMYGTSGNSFVAVVEFGDSIKAKSILAGGINSNPGSVHFDDQALMYTQGLFKDVRFYIEDVRKYTERSYHPGSVLLRSIPPRINHKTTLLIH